MRSIQYRKKYNIALQNKIPSLFLFTESLRVLNEDTARLLILKPGQKLCPLCTRKLNETKEETSSHDTFEPSSAAVVTEYQYISTRKLSF